MSTLRATKLKAGKFDVDVPLVERLVASQFPQWSGLPVRPVANDGWDNWTFHLGDRLKVRLPSAAGYAEQTAKEAKWLPILAPHLPVPIPVPVAVGEPALGYPWNWSVYEWLDGEAATSANVTDKVAFARDVAAFLKDLQAVDPAGGPLPGQHSLLRGALPMQAYGDQARRSVDVLHGEIDTAGAHAVLDAAEAAEATAGPHVWVHGDIAVGNLLVTEGRLSAVIDFGGLTVGDPSCDLVLAWLFFDGDSRTAFRYAIGADPAMWARARAWALWKAALVYHQGPGNAAEFHPREVIDAVVREHRAG